MRRTGGDDFDKVEEALLPVLADAAVGEFQRELWMDASNARRVNELLMGVQVLLEVIREQSRELEATRAKLEQANAKLSKSSNRSLH